MADLMDLLDGLTQQAKNQSDAEIASLALDLAGAFETAPRI